LPCPKRRLPWLPPQNLSVPHSVPIPGIRSHQRTNPSESKAITGGQRAKVSAQSRFAATAVLPANHANWRESKKVFWETALPASAEKANAHHRYCRYTWNRQSICRCNDVPFNDSRYESLCCYSLF
jgi:hypothetical protein